MLKWMRQGDGPWRGLAVFAGVLFFLAWLGGGFEPRDFHRCILANMKGVGHQMAASAIWEACAAIHGEPPPPRRATGAR